MQMNNWSGSSNVGKEYLHFLFDSDSSTKFYTIGIVQTLSSGEGLDLKTILYYIILAYFRFSIFYYGNSVFVKMFVFFPFILWKAFLKSTLLWQSIREPKTRAEGSTTTNMWLFIHWSCTTCANNWYIYLFINLSLHLSTCVPVLAE